MAVIRSPKGSDIHPYQMTQEELFAIGRVVRACAEIEDIITLYLCTLAGIGPGKATVLLGRTGIAAKLALAKTFAYGEGGEVREIFDECFEQEAYIELMRFRNTVAHGVLLGKTDDGSIAFQIAEQVAHTPDSVHVAVNSYESRAFPIFADMANNVIPQLERRLKLLPLRETRRAQPLGPLANVPKRGRRGKGPKPQPKPSRP